MRNIFFTAVCAACVTLTFTSCAKDIKHFADNDKAEMVSREYTDLGIFDGLAATTGFDVKYTVGPVASVKVEVPESLLDYVKVRVEGSRLAIGIDSQGKGLYNIKRLRAYVTGPVLTEIKASSSADIDIVSPMTVKDGKLTVMVSSSADVDFQSPIQYESVNITASSSGDVDMESLTTGEVIISASSSSEVEIGKLTAKNVTVSASSSADVKLSGVADNAVYVASSSADISAGSLKVVSAKATASSAADIVCHANSITSSNSAGGSVKNK